MILTGIVGVVLLAMEVRRSHQIEYHSRNLAELVRVRRHFDKGDIRNFFIEGIVLNGWQRDAAVRIAEKLSLETIEAISATMIQDYRGIDDTVAKLDSGAIKSLAWRRDRLVFGAGFLILSLLLNLFY